MWQIRQHWTCIHGRPQDFFRGGKLGSWWDRSLQQGPAPRNWRHILKIMHKHFVHWDFRQHLSLLMNETFPQHSQHFQVGQVPPLPMPPGAHACFYASVVARFRWLSLTSISSRAQVISNATRVTVVDVGDVVSELAHIGCSPIGQSVSSDVGQLSPCCPRRHHRINERCNPSTDSQSEWLSACRNPYWARTCRLTFQMAYKLMHSQPATTTALCRCVRMKWTPE